MLAYYLPCSSCSERIASKLKLRNQDCCLPFIHLVVSQPRGDREGKGRTVKMENNWNWEGVHRKYSMRCLPLDFLLQLLLGMHVYVETLHIFPTKEF